MSECLYVVFSMKILFLDCETSDLTPLSGQVIEIAGVIATLDPTTLEIQVIDQFETLIQNRKPFDEKITRLTGITELQLTSSPKLADAQENWANWLDKYQSDSQIICGHSIDFDLKFLKAENWFLPEKAKIIDTLQATKILFTFLQAVNLESLVEKLDLADFFTEKRHLVKPNPSQAHRALYDTWCTIALLQEIVSFLKKQYFTREFYDFLKDEILPLKIEYYPNPKPLQPNLKPQNQSNQTKINLLGEIIPRNLSEKLNYICSQPKQAWVNQILDLLKSPIELELKVILAAIYASIVYKNNNLFDHFKLHTHSYLEKIFVECLFDSFEEETVLKQPQSNCILDRFEDILWQIKSLSEETLDLGRFIWLLEVWQKIHPKNHHKQIARVLTEYDFFLFAIEPFWALNNYQYWYKPDDMVGEETILKQKLTSLFNSIKNLPHFEASNELEKAVVKKINSFLKEIHPWDTNTNLYLKFTNQKLTASKIKLGFDLSSYFAEFFDRFPNLQIQTYLSESDFKLLLDVADLTDVFNDLNPKIVYYNQNIETFVTKNTSSLVDFLQEKHNLATEKQSPVLILSGNNSALKKIQKSLTDNLHPNDYLSLGESGSLTKIYSKLIRNFVGVVNIRIGDFGFITSQKNCPNFAEIWLVGEPLIFVQQYWQKLAKQTSQPELFTQTIQNLNLAAQAGFIYYKTNQVVNYLKNFES